MIIGATVQYVLEKIRWENVLILNTTRTLLKSLYLNVTMSDAQVQASADGGK